MLHLIALFGLESKRFFSKRNLILFLFMFLIFLYGVNKGVDQYKDSIANSKEFQKVEKLIFSNVVNYTHYSFFGVRYLFVPSASAIFFSDTPMMSELSAKIDSTVTLKIYNDCKGSAVFKGNNRGVLRFSELMILLGTLFVLFTGYESMRRKEFLKFICGSFSRVKTFLSIIFIRFLLIVLTLMAMFAVILWVVKLRGVELTTLDFKGLLAYLIVTLLTLLIFLIIGGIIGTIRSNTLSVTLILGIWIVSVFIVPAIVDSVTEEMADNVLSSAKADLNKWQKMREFENNTEEKYGKFDRQNIVTEREIVEDYFDEDYPKIAKVEKNLREEIARVTGKYSRISIFFPTAFYNLTALEVSSRGYENYLKFYDYIQKCQKAFVKFFIGRIYYNSLNQLVNFIKGDEILFRGQSQKPSNFLPGMILQLCYTIGLLLVSYNRFRKWLETPTDKKSFNEKDRDIRLKKEQVNVLYSHRPGLRDQLYFVFSKRGSKSKSSPPPLHVTLEGDTVDELPLRNRFVYICHPSAIPGDIKPKDLISYVIRANRVPAAQKVVILRGLSSILHSGQSFNRLEAHQQADILLTILPYIKGNFYLVDQVGKEMPLSILVKLKDQLQTLVKAGGIVIYITPDKRVEALPTQLEREVLDLPDWFEAVEAHRFLLDEETGKWRTIAKSRT